MMTIHFISTLLNGTLKLRSILISAGSISVRLVLMWLWTWKSQGLCLAGSPVVARSVLLCNNVIDHHECCVLVFLVLQAKHLAQLVVAGLQVVGRAFAKALRQEIAGEC